MRINKLEIKLLFIILKPSATFDFALNLD